jgi:hypothetical protein
VRSASDFYCKSVTGEILTHVCPLDPVPLTSFIGDANRLNILRLFKKRHGVSNVTCGPQSACWTYLVCGNPANFLDFAQGRTIRVLFSYMKIDGAVMLSTL